MNVFLYVYTQFPSGRIPNALSGEKEKTIIKTFLFQMTLFANGRRIQKEKRNPYLFSWSFNRLHHTIHSWFLRMQYQHVFVLVKKGKKDTFCCWRQFWMNVFYPTFDCCFSHRSNGPILRAAYRSVFSTINRL